MYVCYIVFVKQKTAYEMRISDWSADVCSSDLSRDGFQALAREFTGPSDTRLRSDSRTSGNEKVRRALVDPGFSRLDKSEALVGLPPDLAVLMVAVSARQGACPVALFFARMACQGAAARLVATARGDFNAGVAPPLRR